MENKLFYMTLFMVNPQKSADLRRVELGLDASGWKHNWIILNIKF